MFQIRDGFDNMDFEKVTNMLSNAYWCLGIKIDEVKRSAMHSAVVIGAFQNGEQIGYARAVSDTNFAYIMDVFVDERYRKQGIGQSMVQSILEYKELVDVKLWLLATQDAHGVYQKCGFQPLADPGKWMEIRKPRPQS